MKIIENFGTKAQYAPSVATIGFFDGVHIGHRFLIEQLKEEAAHLKLTTAVITFSVHPRKVLNSDFQPSLLCSYKEKLDKLSDIGLDNCISLNFTQELARLSAKEFIQEVLKKELNVKVLIIGYDHRFGHNRTDGFEEYKRYGKEVGLDVVQAKKLNSTLHVSSSHIRQCLKEGNVQLANQMLGYEYNICGKIVEGFKVGRTIGFPTANIKIWEDFKVVPAFGVYAVYVNIGQQRYGGMLYIGKRPTLHNGDNISLEVNIFDFDEDLYGKTLSVEFIEFVRPDEKFPNLEILIEHITQDKNNVLKILDHLNEHK